MPGQAFAYLRASKLDQDLEKNKLDILKLANEAHLGHVQFIEEKISGNISWRKRQIAAILKSAQEGDVLMVSELSHLGRSMLECGATKAWTARKYRTTRRNLSHWMKQHGIVVIRDDTAHDEGTRVPPTSLSDEQREEVLTRVEIRYAGPKEKIPAAEITRTH
ncbi:MAG: recombinase family protein [Ktedonobacteraceae bacterium]|nr:recombinase family protein [Ktedonobacteraceae bacterium]